MQRGDNDGDSFAMQTNMTLSFTPELKTKSMTLPCFLVSIVMTVEEAGQSMFVSNTASAFLSDPSIDGRNNSVGSASSNYAQTRSVGLLISGQYKFLDRYILNAGVRGDGNSKFGSAHRYGIFPSASVRWRVSGEPFMKKLNKYVDDFSFRAKLWYRR
jgi:outer membrane receptor protein involved in Fe transport